VAARPLLRRLIARIVIDIQKVDLLVDDQAMRNELLGVHSAVLPKGNRPKRIVRLQINARLQRCGRERRFILPRSSVTAPNSHPVQSLIKAVVRARGWYEQVVRGELTSIRSIAIATGLNERYVSRIFQFAFLAPDIVESILDGRQPWGLTLENFRTNLPTDWVEQRQRLLKSEKDRNHLREREASI
jgi:site-specific DNA recombinase